MQDLRFRQILFWVLIFSALINNPAAARRLENVNFLPEHRLDGVSLAFQGAGVIKHLFFTVNASALYLAENSGVEDPLADIPKRLEFEYFYKIKAEDFVKLTNKWLAENNDDDIVTQLQPRLDRFNALYEDVQPGDRYAISYLPGKGTELSLNGEVLGIVEGADFAQAVFSIWLGPKPVSKSLKLALLADSR